MRGSGANTHDHLSIAFMNRACIESEILSGLSIISRPCTVHYGDSCLVKYVSFVFVLFQSLSHTVTATSSYQGGVLTTLTALNIFLASHYQRIIWDGDPDVLVLRF